MSKLPLLAVLLSVLGGPAGAVPTKDGGAEVILPAGWTQEAPVSSDDVFQMSKGASMYSMAVAESRSGLGGLCARLKAERLRMVELGKAPKPIAVFQGPGRNGCLFSITNKDASTTLQGYVVGPGAAYSFILNNSRLETFGQIMDGISLKGGAGPTRSRTANAVIAALPKERHPLGPLHGRFLGKAAGYGLSPVSEGGLLVKGPGIHILFEGARFERNGAAGDKAEADFLNALAPDSVVDPSRCKARGMMPVSKDAARWMFRLFACPGDSDTMLLGTLKVGKAVLAAQGRATDDKGLKLLRLWAETAEFDPAP